jgi:23S rRNA (uracil1939-C5)-methyltransferase
MLSKGKKVELKIASLVPGGEGVSKDFAIPVFINKVAPGDRLLAEIYDNRRTFAKGQLLQLIEPSEDRIEPPCKLFKVCGGCQWMHINYTAQLNYKRDLIEQSLLHIAGQELGKELSQVLMPTIGSEEQLAYRNKVQLPVRNPNDSKRLLAGYFETNSHNLVNIKHCPIQPNLLDSILEQIKILAEKYEITAYNEKIGQGLLRHINMRINKDHNAVLVTLVLNCKQNNLSANLKELASLLAQQFEQIKGVCVNFNDNKGNRILGDQTLCLTGEPYIEESISSQRKDLPQKLQSGLRFRLSPESFFQINTNQAIKLLEIIAEQVKEFIPANNDQITLLDAYAGVGTIALWLSPFVSKVIAIESNPQAVKDGQINQKLNNIENVHFQLNKVEDYLPTMLKNKSSVDIVVLDPPRQGLKPEVVEAIIKLQPKLIIYVSCNPVTLARDLRLILSSESPNLIDPNDIDSKIKNSCLNSNFGYKVEKIIPVDLFPQTYHIESVTVLKRQ